MQTEKKDTNESEAETPYNKRQQSPDTPKPSRSRKHRRQQQQEQTQSLINRMAQAVQTLCSSLQPVSILPQSPRQRRMSAIKLLEQDGDFKKSDSVPVIRLFTSSIDVIDSYLAIEDKEVHTLYIEDAPTSHRL